MTSCRAFWEPGINRRWPNLILFYYLKSSLPPAFRPSFVGPHNIDVRKWLVDSMKGVGIGIYTWTVNDATEASWMQSIGVFAFGTDCIFDGKKTK